MESEKQCRFGKNCNKQDCKFKHDSNNSEEGTNQSKLRSKVESNKQKYRESSGESRSSTSNKCRYGKVCKNMLHCKFGHTEEQRKYFKLNNIISSNKEKPRDNSGESKKSRSNNCKYGKECRNMSNCKFSHSEQELNYFRLKNKVEQNRENHSESSEESKQSKSNRCRRGNTCLDMLNCKFSHSEKQLNLFKSKSTYNKNKESKQEKNNQQKHQNNSQIINNDDIDSDDGNNNSQIKENKICPFGQICNNKNCKDLHTEEEKELAKRNTDKDRSQSINTNQSQNDQFEKNKDTKSQNNNQQKSQNNNSKIKNSNKDKKPKESQFVFYKSTDSKQDCPHHKKCHWFDIFGKCDLNRCNFSHNFKPNYQCVFIEQGKECKSKNIPKYALKSQYDCNQKQKINNCHSYTINGECNQKICSFLHKDILGSCPYQKKCQICKPVSTDEKDLNKIRDQSEKEEKKQYSKNDKNYAKQKNMDPPQIVYYMDEYQLDVPEDQKCHWYDITGKCDLSKCTQQHKFLPRYECKFIQEGQTCPGKFPQYINKKYDCNKRETRNVCHDYNLEGQCKFSICKYIHRQITGKCSIPRCKFCDEKKEQNLNKIQEIELDMKKKYFYQVETFNIRLKEMEQKIHQQIKKNKQQETLDLMFIVDCTSSMGRWISFVKNKIKQITDSVKIMYPRYSFRYNFVGYRDFGDAKVENFDFSEDLDKFINHVNGIRAIGGGDIPEDMASGLKDGLKQKFRSFVKAVFLIYDAPNHGLKYHDGEYEDDHQNENEEIEKYISQYAKCNTYFTQMMLKSGGTYIAQKTCDAIQAEYQKNDKQDYMINIKLKGDEDDNEIEKLFSTSITTSITHSKLNSQSSTAQLVENPILKQIKYNKILSVKPVNLYIRNFDFSIQWNNPFIIEEESSFTYEIEIQNPIDSGASRTAYKAKDITLNKDIVVKFDMKVNPRLNLYNSMKEQQETQVISAFIVNEFRDLVIPYVSSLQSLPYYINSNIAKFDVDSYCYIETYLESFDKFSNNSDYQKEAKTENEKLLECLPHFSFQYTEGYLMITDLQGHGSILTDPCIHTIDNKKFGKTNLGVEGISKYFAQHKCNEFCQRLKLIHPNVYNPNNILQSDYQKQVEEMSKDAIQNIKNIALIQSYTNKQLFCDLCESYDLKNTEINKDKPKDLKQFANEFCVECTAKNFNLNSKLKDSCKECKTEYTIFNYWIKRKRGRLNGKCPSCNKIEYLQKIKEYYRIKNSYI